MSPFKNKPKVHLTLTGKIAVLARSLKLLNYHVRQLESKTVNDPEMLSELKQIDKDLQEVMMERRY